MTGPPSRRERPGADLSRAQAQTSSPDHLEDYSRRLPNATASPATSGTGLTKRLARAMARRHHELELEDHLLHGIAPPDAFARDRFLDRMVERDWPDFVEYATAAVLEINHMMRQART